MKKEITEYTCDICGKNIPETYPHLIQQSIQVMFTTEQTEGRPVTPYLSMCKIDICIDCRNHLIKGNYIFASGAMGHNRYYFKEGGQG